MKGISWEAWAIYAGLWVVALGLACIGGFTGMKLVVWITVESIAVFVYAWFKLGRPSVTPWLLDMVFGEDVMRRMRDR